MLNSLKLILLFLALGLTHCSREDLEDSKATVTSGGPSLEKADELKFISDVSWLKDAFSKLDQAGVPWVMGSLLFTQKVGGTAGIPVIFDASVAPDVKVSVKIEVGGSATLGKRAPITIFERDDVELMPMQLSAFININGKTAEYEKVPDSVPFVGGKTVVPMYFMIDLTEYDWAKAGATIKDQFTAALKAGNLASLVSSVSNNLPVPWLDCETVKMTVKYKGTATEDGKYQVEATKFIAADPQVTIDLLGILAEGAGPMIKEQTGFDVSMIVNALKSVPVPTCSAPTDADKAIFK